jgi:hypothetical protein
MKLVFIYGPPAAGKLTVAKEVAARTGFKVFHNHLSIDCIEPVFEFGSPSFGKLVNMIRYETVAEAARQGVDLIYTFCYAAGLDDDHVRTIAGLVEANGGEVHFVLLTCETAELHERVRSQSRAKFRKVRGVELLQRLLDQYDLYSTVPGHESLCIDNTDISPEATAALIIEHFGLRGPREMQKADRGSALNHDL